jgi:hypothetical protein
MTCSPRVWRRRACSPTLRATPTCSPRVWGRQADGLRGLHAMVVFPARARTPGPSVLDGPRRLHVPRARGRRSAACPACCGGLHVPRSCGHADLAGCHQDGEGACSPGVRARQEKRRFGPPRKPVSRTGAGRGNNQPCQRGPGSVSRTPRQKDAQPPSYGLWRIAPHMRQGGGLPVSGRPPWGTLGAAEAGQGVPRGLIRGAREGCGQTSPTAPAAGLLSARKGRVAGCSVRIGESGNRPFQRLDGAGMLGAGRGTSAPASLAPVTGGRSSRGLDRVCRPACLRRKQQSSRRERHRPSPEPISRRKGRVPGSWMGVAERARLPPPH